MTTTISSILPEELGNVSLLALPPSPPLKKLQEEKTNKNIKQQTVIDRILMI